MGIIKSVFPSDVILKHILYEIKSILSPSFKDELKQWFSPWNLFPPQKKKNHLISVEYSPLMLNVMFNE